MVGTGFLSGVSPNAFVSALTFTTNYSPHAIPNVLAHTWSLSVEEQFYLLWPATLSALVKRFGQRLAAKTALALVLLAPILRVLTYAVGGSFGKERIYYMLHTRMDALMFGCLLALVVETDEFERLFESYKGWVLPLALFTLLISPLATARWGGAYIYTVGLSIEGASVALTTLWLVRNPQSLIGTVLSSRAMVHIGVVSYGLYLWQELMLKSNMAISRWPLLAIACALLLAEISYHLVEQPCLRRYRAWRTRHNDASRIQVRT